jgi:hypothetical protein
MWIFQFTKEQSSLHKDVILMITIKHDYLTDLLCPTNYYEMLFIEIDTSKKKILLNLIVIKYIKHMLYLRSHIANLQYITCINPIDRYSLYYRLTQKIFNFFCTTIICINHITGRKLFLYPFIVHRNALSRLITFFAKKKKFSC